MGTPNNQNLACAGKFQCPDLWIHTGLLISGLAALFFLLTSGIPLVQLGWMGDLGKKSRYVLSMLILVPVFAALMFLAWWKFRAIFDRCIWVRFWRAASQVSLRYLVPGFFFVYAAMMAVVGFERHLAMETRAFDLGIFAQAVWNTLQGDFLFSSIKGNINLMGDHVSPILLLAVPFYGIWPDPRTLVLLQAVAAASSFFPLALIARDKLKDRSLVLIFLLMLFFFQPMRAALHEDFHPEVFAEPFLWWAFFFLDRGRVLRFLLCLIVAATGKENFLGIAFILGFYAFVWKKMRWSGAIVMISSVAVLFWETKWLVPRLSGTAYFYGGNYSRMLADPLRGVVFRLLNAESLEYILKIFIPFLFLPFFHLPTLLLACPVLFQNLLSANGAMRSFNYHYITGMTPFLFISTIYALASLIQKRVWIKQYKLLIGFLLLFVCVLRSGPFEYWFFWNSQKHRTSHVEMVRKRLQAVPGDVRVLTHNSLIPQVINRKYIYQFDYNPAPDKLILAEAVKADLVIWDVNYWEPNTEPPEQALPRFLVAGYTVDFEQDGFCILRKRPQILQES